MKTRVVKQWHRQAARFVFYVESYVLRDDPVNLSDKHWEAYPGGWESIPFDTFDEADKFARMLAGLTPLEARGRIREFVQSEHGTDD